MGWLCAGHVRVTTHRIRGGFLEGWGVRMEMVGGVSVGGERGHVAPSDRELMEAG